MFLGLVVAAVLVLNMDCASEGREVGRVPDEEAVAATDEGVDIARETPGMMFPSAAGLGRLERCQSW